MTEMKPKTRPFQNAAVKAVYDDCSPEARSRLLAIRELIFDTAQKTDGVGEIEETLKWSEPAYLTVRPKCGSTIRLNAVSKEPDKVAAYFICTTNLVSRFREQYPDQFEYRDNRALVFDIKDDISHEALSHCFAMALTYHLRK